MSSTKAMSGAEAAKIVFRHIRNPSGIPKDKYLPLVEAILLGTSTASINKKQGDSLKRKVIICRNLSFKVGNIKYSIHFEICYNSLSCVIINRKNGSWKAFGIAHDGKPFTEYLDNFFDCDGEINNLAESKSFYNKFHALLLLHGGIGIDQPSEDDEPSPGNAPISRWEMEQPQNTFAVSSERIPGYE